MKQTVSTQIDNSHREEVDMMAKFLKTLPEKAQEYIRGCVDMASLLSKGAAQSNEKGS